MSDDTGNLQPLLGNLVPAATGYVDAARGAKIYYELYGDTDHSHKTLVFINGANGKIPFAGHIVQRMVRLGYRVLLHEARGIGRSTCRPGRQTTRLLAADCLAVVDGCLGPGCCFYLMGISMGGMVAQELLHRLVVTGQTSRLLAAFLAVTTPGKRWRPSPLRRARHVRRTVLPQLSYKDQADFDNRFPASLDWAFGREWLDAPAAPPQVAGPTRGSQPLPPAEPKAKQPQPEPPQPQQQQQQQPQHEPAASSAEEGGSEGTPADPQSQVPPPPPPSPPPSPPSSAAPAPAPAAAPATQAPEQAGQQPTRRELLRALWSGHWRQMGAFSAEEMDPGVLWHMTAHVSHFMGPRRAAAIRAAGLRIGVGVAASDLVHPPAEGRCWRPGWARRSTAWARGTATAASTRGWAGWRRARWRLSGTAGAESRLRGTCTGGGRGRPHRTVPYCRLSVLTIGDGRG